MTERTYADRIVFHPDLQVMEVDFSDLTFDLSRTVHDFYDEVDRQIVPTKQKWFFLVNYKNCHIMPEAWIAFAHRGKVVNLGYSLGSARFAAPDDTSEVIQEKSKEESFDPNLFTSRDSALSYLQDLRARIPVQDYQMVITKEKEPKGRSISDRVTFHDDLEIMEVDFSDCTFATSADVNAFYDKIGDKIAKTGRKWYFMVNYAGTEILPEAWYRWTVSSQRLNGEYSLGTVRFNPDEAARDHLEKRARVHAANPNLAGSRDEALARIAELQKAAG